MKGFKRTKGPILSGVLAVAVFAGLAVGVSQSFAGQGSATAPVRSNRDSCGSTSDRKVIGTASFVKKGLTVTVHVQIHDGPSGTYYLYLYYGNCADSGYYAKFKVDASGDGSRSLTATIPYSAQDFFVDAYNVTLATDNESDLVKL